MLIQPKEAKKILGSKHEDLSVNDIKKIIINLEILAECLVDKVYCQYRKDRDERSNDA